MPGPPRQFDHTLEVKVTSEMYTFLTDLAVAIDTSKAAVLRALAEAHMNYLSSLASQYVKENNR